MNPFVLGRVPGPNDRIVGKTLHKIMGFDYVRYSFEDEQGPFKNWYIWADILLQVQILTSAPFLQPLRMISPCFYFRERDPVDLF